MRAKVSFSVHLISGGNYVLDDTVTLTYADAKQVQKAVQKTLQDCEMECIQVNKVA
jgi:ribosomal protein S5